MHILCVTTLYPNAEQIRNGVFVRERVRRFLMANPDTQVTVIAPVPWFPFKARRFGRYGTFARVPREERDGDVRVLHPRFLQIPKVGELVAPLAYRIAVQRCLQHYRVEMPDLIDAHFAFPDGVAAVMLGSAIGRPVSITVRGSDINLIARERIAGRWIRWALARAGQVVAVSSDLARRVRSLLPEHSDTPIEVVRNGVDLARFQPCPDVAGLRARLALHGRVVLSVGNLIPLKGHDLVIRAVAGIDDATLCIVGDGPERASLSRLTEELGISLRVRFLGEMAQDRLAEYYNAADVTVLASSNEGLPNVILESMACGTQVIATRVGGVPEVMTNPTMGVMVEQRHPDAIREAILNRPAKTPEHAAQVRECVSGFDWDVTACRLRKLFSRLCRDQMPTARLAAAKEE